MIELKPRDKQKPAKEYRKEGLIPGILYGPNIESTLVYVDEQIAQKNFNFTHQRFQIVFNNQRYLGILQEIQKDPISLKIIHFDIYIPSLVEAITTTIPVIFKGEEEILRNGWYLNKTIDELEIEGLLKDLPNNIELDVSELKLGESICVKDINIPNVKILLDPETPIASVIEQKLIEEETPQEEVKENLESSISES
ncbi:MAG: 50S ribosomal protein L25 [Candidatus Parcubacteria bacterium]|nr:MAG: 50S ribosomal protein L25 [Candidatus Parcubacteria bacterium]